MPSPAIVFGGFVGPFALVMAPVAAILAILAATTALTAVQALAGLAGAALLTAPVVGYWYRDVLILGDWLRRLEAPEATSPVRPPQPESAAGRRLAGIVDRLQRSWRTRERQLSRELQAADAIIEALTDPLLILDADRTVVRANDAAAALYGDDWVGRDLADRLRHPDVLAAADGVLAGGAARTLDFTEPVPVERVYEVRITPFAGASGGVEVDDGAGPDRTVRRPRALVALHDITAIKRSEQMRADFVANASHELRTPLSSLIGFIETLRGPAREDADARDRFLGIMEQQAGRMNRLIHDLLSLSRIELDEHTPPTGRVDLSRVLGTVADLARLRAKERSVTVVLEIPESLPTVPGDPDQLTQVFQNLVDNAINYGRPETEVTICARAVARAADGRGAGVAVTVRDRGEGIPKAHLPRLTERFYRVDPARSRAIGGTGLGLAIVKHIVSRHRGRLSVESEIGQGSSFTVFLPAERRGRRGAEDADAAAGR